MWINNLLVLPADGEYVAGVHREMGQNWRRLATGAQDTILPGEISDLHVKQGELLADRVSNCL